MDVRVVGRRERRAVLFCLTVAVLVAALGWTTAARNPSTRPVERSPAIAPSVALSLLRELPDGQLARGVAYDREAVFGPAWADVDHNGCDTRNDVLQRDLKNAQTRSGTHTCVVISGLLLDPYTGALMPFAKADASDIQIDHLVPLHAAWMLGAYRWPQQRRIAYANDPRVLLAVSGEANQDKSDQLADTWRPSNKGDWCAYATDTVVIHVAYALPVTRPERAALSSMIGTCPT